VFTDITSGSRRATDRPGMRRLLEYATTGDTIVVWRIDRLGRSLIDVLNTVNLLQQRGIGLRSIQDGIDPATTSGKMLLNLLASLAEYERELITERVQARHRRRQSLGHPLRPATSEPERHRRETRNRQRRPSQGPQRFGRRPPRRMVTRHPLPPPAGGTQRRCRGIGRTITGTRADRGRSFAVEGSGYDRR